VHDDKKTLVPQETSMIDILDGCKSNSPRYQKELYDTFCGYALAICMRYTRDRWEALEIMHDGFVKVFRGLHQFMYPEDPGRLSGSFRNWLKKIMIYTAIDYYRTGNRQVQSLDMVGEESYLTDLQSMAYPDDQLSYKELILMIQLLSPSYRTVFNLYVIDGFSHEEIAAILGISVSTSRSNLAKAKEHLRNLLKKTYEKVLVKYN
jgi:RNA polymerase sigma factor (sigma-70 family)